MRLILITITAALIACRSAPPDVREQQLIEHARRIGDCSQVDHVVQMLHVSEEDRAFIQDCWTVRQKEIISRARANGNCRSVDDLPGVYPNGGTVDEQRFVYRCWMSTGIHEMDACIGMMHIADSGSVPAIQSVLKRNEPMRDPKDGRFSLIDTAGACLTALATATGATDVAIDAMVKDWNPAWRAWAARNRLADDVERQIRAQYDLIERAYAAQDLPAILTTRAENFEIVDPVSKDDNLNYEKFAEVMRVWFEKNKPPIVFRVTIESVEIRSSDEVAVRVLQRASRYQQRSDRLHHIEHEVRQRETWTRTATGWKVKKIDEIDIANRKVWDDGKVLPPGEQ